MVFICTFTGMNQLDLFGNPVQTENEKAPVKKPAQVKNDADITHETAEKRETEIQESSDIVFEEVSDLDMEISQTTENVTPDFGEEVIQEAEPKPFATAENAAGEQADKKSALPTGRGRKSYKEMDADVHLVEVPDDELLFKKQYYSISEVAQWFNVNNSLIRFWENEFDVLKPRKNRKGDRLFRPEDVKNLQLIYYLLREKKFSIEGARQYIKDNRKKAELNMQLINSLTKFRGFLLELKATLEA